MAGNSNRINELLKECHCRRDKQDNLFDRLHDMQDNSFDHLRDKQECLFDRMRDKQECLSYHLVKFSEKQVRSSLNMSVQLRILIRVFRTVARSLFPTH